MATRVSNGLKEFLWNLDGLGRGTLLDLGPAWQTTLNFFIERGFRVSSEDILRGWKAFLDEEEGRMAVLRGGALREDPSRDSLDMTPEGRAARFFKTNLQYAPASFDAVLLWDVLDYLDPAMTKQTIACLTELLRPAGIVFAMFHSKKPEGFQRYRVADSNTLQVIPANIVTPSQKVYQNREIQDLFSVLSHHQVIRGPRPVARNFVHQVKPLLNPVNFTISSLAFLILQAYKTLVSSKSSGGEHDSTGLGAKQKLNTPLLRCASPAIATLD